MQGNKLPLSKILHGSGSIGQSGNYAIISSLPDQGCILPARLEEQVPITLSREGCRYPTVRVICQPTISEVLLHAKRNDIRKKLTKVPCRNANTPSNISASLHCRLVVLNLLQLRRISWRKCSTDIEFRNRNIDTQRHKCIHVFHLRRCRRRLAYNEVRLQAHAINLNISVLEAFHQRLCGRGFVARRLDIIVVVVQLHAQAVPLDCRLSSRKRNVDETRPDNLVPNILAPGILVVKIAGAGVVERLVHNVPGIASITKVSHEIVDVVLEDGRQCRVGPVSRGQPRRKLVVPIEVMAAYELVVGGGDGEELLGLSVIEYVLLLLCVDPLQMISLDSKVGAQESNTFMAFAGVNCPKS